MPVMQLVRRASMATSLVALTACNFFDVSNPGPIADEDLNTASAMAGLVTGMSFDLSQAIDATAPVMGPTTAMVMSWALALPARRKTEFRSCTVSVCVGHARCSL